MPDDPIEQPSFGAEPTWRFVAEFMLPAAADQASTAVKQVIAAVADYQLSPARREQLARATVGAVHKAAMQNRRLRLELPMQISVSVAALADRVTACCLGFFVIARTADRLSATDGPAHHLIELFLYKDTASLRKTAV